MMEERIGVKKVLAPTPAQESQRRVPTAVLNFNLHVYYQGVLLKHRF